MSVIDKIRLLKAVDVGLVIANINTSEERLNKMPLKTTQKRGRPKKEQKLITTKNIYLNKLFRPIKESTLDGSTDNTYNLLKYIIEVEEEKYNLTSFLAKDYFIWSNTNNYVLAGRIYRLMMHYNWDFWWHIAIVFDLFYLL